MNHIDMYEQTITDYALDYDIRSIVIKLHSMKMNDMLKTRELIDEFVDKKHNDYMLIFTHEERQIALKEEI